MIFDPIAGEHFDDIPYLLESSSAREARLGELRQPHIAPLTAFVDKLREMGADYQIPYFDPWDGGTSAEVLYLLEVPGPKAKGSGFISRNNPDPSAKNFFGFNQQIGILRKRTATWNIVPWYLGRRTKSCDIDAGIRSLHSLLNLLPKVRCVVLFGRVAQRAEPHITKLRPSIRLFMTRHPSNQSINRFPNNRSEILDVLKEVADFLDM